jgi:hypothetical protein
MNARTVAGLLLSLAVAGAVYALWPKEQLSPEDQIRSLVAKTVAAAEKRDVGEVVEALDERFRGPGGAGKAEVKQLLVGQFFRAQQVVVMNPLLEVSAATPTSGHFKGTFVFARDGAAIDASKYEIEADLEKVDGEWRLVSASWNR